MDTESKTYVFGNEGNNSVPAWLAYGNNGGWGNGFGGGNFWGAGIGGFLGSALGNWIGGNGFGMNGGGAAAAALGAQATANNNTDLLIQAISSNGEQSRQAIQTVSNMLGQDFATVSAQFGAINGILNNMAIQNATTPLQIINQICSGNKDLAATFAQCCCENKLLVTTQGYEAQIATLNQTNQLGSQADRNANNIINAINGQTIAMNDGFCAIKERELQQQIDAKNDIIAQLRAQANNQSIINQVAMMLNPLQAQVNLIAARQPQTVPVIWPQLTVTDGTATATTSVTNG
jgi:hypothetical protein